MIALLIGVPVAIVLVVGFTFLFLWMRRIEDEISYLEPPEMDENARRVRQLGIALTAGGGGMSAGGGI